MRLALFSARMTGFSGVELYTLDLALALARAGHKVSVHSDGWSDHLSTPLQADGVQVASFSDQQRVDACISPKYRPIHAAHQFGAPVVQVIHSEHNGDIPLEHPMTRGFCMIRSNQERLIKMAGEWAEALPRALIRNPIGFHRDSYRGSMIEPQFDGIMVSEFDDMKAALAVKYQEKVGEKLLLIGPWRSERLPPPGACQRDPTLEVWWQYRYARSAFSYRLSRQVPEALHCGVPCWVYGGLEPERPTCEDDPDDWKLLLPGIDLEPFTYEHVAARWQALLEKVVA